MGFGESKYCPVIMSVTWSACTVMSGCVIMISYWLVWKWLSHILVVGKCSVELSWPVVGLYESHLPIRPLWAWPWAKICISENTGWIFSRSNFYRIILIFSCATFGGHLPIRPYGRDHGPKTVSLKSLDGFSLNSIELSRTAAVQL